MSPILDVLYERSMEERFLQCARKAALIDSFNNGVLVPLLSKAVTVTTGSFSLIFAGDNGLLTSSRILSIHESSFCCPMFMRVVFSLLKNCWAF